MDNGEALLSALETEMEKPVPYIKFDSVKAIPCPICEEVQLGGEAFAEGMNHLEYVHHMRLLHISSEIEGSRKHIVIVFGPTTTQRNRWTWHRAKEKLRQAGVETEAE